MSLKIGFVCLCISAAVCVQSASISSSESLFNISDTNSENSTKFYDGDNDYGYAEVRPGAFMFWWLYYAGGDKNTAYEKPFVIWIQGGPSIPGSGVGNFLEIGPQDMQLNERKSSWVHERNVLFIDSPVGTGFSYVNDSALHVKNDKELAYDLVELMKQFLKKFPKFETIPSHIFSQSYGGKIAPRFAYYLHKEIKSGEMKMNLKSVGLGSAFVSPKDSNSAYAEYMYNMGYIDQLQYAYIKNITQKLAKACDQKQYKQADALRHEMLSLTISDDNFHFNVFNVMKPSIYHEIDNLEVLMERTVKSALSDVVPTDTAPWQFYRRTVVDEMSGDIMKPSIYFVEKLLNETDIRVVVYNGNLDAATPIAGAVNWVHRLKWHGAEGFQGAPRKNIRGLGNGHYKSHGQLSFWWVYNAGHWVPSENPEAMEHILNVVVDSVEEAIMTEYDIQQKNDYLRDIIFSNLNKKNRIHRGQRLWPVDKSLNFTSLINIFMQANNFTMAPPTENYEAATEMSVEENYSATEYPMSNQTVLDIPNEENNWTTRYPNENITLLELPSEENNWTTMYPNENNSISEVIMDEVVSTKKSEEIQE